MMLLLTRKRFYGCIIEPSRRRVATEVGQWLFMLLGNNTAQNHYSFRKPLQIIQQLVVLLDERLQSLLAGECFVVAVRQKDHRGLQLGDQVDEILIALLRLKVSARFAPHRVARPAQVAERDPPAGITGGEHRFDVAVAPLALEERVADKYDAVAV